MANTSGLMLCTLLATTSLHHEPHWEYV